MPNILKGDEGAGLLQGLGELANDFWVRENVVENLVEVNYRNLRPEARRVAETLAVFARPVPKVAVDFLLQPHVPGLRLEEVLQPLVNARLVYLERGGAGQPTTLGLHRIDRDFLYQRLPTEGAYSRATLHHRAAEFYRTQRTVGPRGWSNITELLPQILEYGHLVQAGDYDAAAILLGEYAGAIAHCGHPTQVRDLYLTLPDRLTSDRARISHELTALVWKGYLGPISEGLKAGEHALELAIGCAGPAAGAAGPFRIGHRLPVCERQCPVWRSRRADRRARRCCHPTPHRRKRVGMTTSTSTWCSPISIRGTCAARRRWRDGCTKSRVESHEPEIDRHRR